ncbi:MAG: tetratricopeptide repeat protein, partial [Bacteroides sp.]
MEQLRTIQEFISRGDISQAIEALDIFIETSASPNDEAYYLRGNAYRKQGNWQMALNNYLEAIE